VRQRRRDEVRRLQEEQKDNESMPEPGFGYRSKVEVEKDDLFFIKLETVIAMVLLAILAN